MSNDDKYTDSSTGRCASSKPSIYEACRSGKAEHTAQALDYIQKGGCLMEGDGLQMTMLHHAAFGGNLEVAQAILSALPPQAHDLLDAQDVGGWTALHYAVDQGHVAMVQLLLDEGANANLRDENKRTPLHLASLRGGVEVVQILLAHGGSKLSKNAASMTPKECARVAGHSLLEALL